MGLSENLKKYDAHSSVSKEFRVYTTQGAILSMVTLALIVYLVVVEAYFNFQITLTDRVHVNATSPRGLEMEFDISLPKVSCSHVFIDASDPTGQSQSLHLDTKHHVWKHRYKINPGTNRPMLIGSKEKLELGSTMLSEETLEEKIYKVVSKSQDSADSEDPDSCGSCYGAGEEGECCNTCDDVRRAYKRKGWVLRDTQEIKQCKKEGIVSKREDADEGCNVHGVVALSSGGGTFENGEGSDVEASMMRKAFLMEISVQETSISVQETPLAMI